MDQQILRLERADTTGEIRLPIRSDIGDGRRVVRGGPKTMQTIGLRIAALPSLCSAIVKATEHI